MKHRIKIGDCFVIPLPDGRYAYCQYVQWNEKLGYLVRVFDRITDDLIKSVDELREAGEMFPPVFVGLRASVKSGRWNSLGWLPVANFEFPLFRSTNTKKPGKSESWWLFDGKDERFIGSLPSELRSLEHKLVWGDELLEKRIVTGRNPYAETY